MSLTKSDLEVVPFSEGDEIKPGTVYSGMPNALYHMGPGISKSGLDMIHLNPAKYRLEKESPRPDPQYSYIGSAFHCLVLEPDEFDSRFVQSKYTEFRSKEAKEWRVEMAAEGLQVLGVKGQDPWLPSEWDLVHRMADAVRDHPQAGVILRPDDILVEASAYWIDDQSDEYHEATHRLCKCRPDAWNREIEIIVDLKSTVDASLTGFTANSRKFRYEVAAAWYQWGLRGHLGIPSKAFCIVACEKDPPYKVELYTFGPDEIAWGMQQAMSDLLDYHEYMDAERWDSTTGEIRTITYSEWQKRGRVR